MTSPSPAEKPVRTRRTRFVCISDTHNSFPGGGFKLPPGDVLIHAGDLTNQGSYEELEKAVKWIEEADFEVKIVVAGNHDITMDSGFYNQYGLYFHSPSPYDPAKCRALFENSPSITYLRHESATICLDRPSGPQTTFKIFGSPYSPAKGMWAFGYSPFESPLLWDAIPFDTDIVVTHTPPKYHLDERGDRRSVGCPSLRERLWRVRPRLVVCGHVHESRGAEIVSWDLTQRNIKYKEGETVVWNDPGAGEGNKKFSIVNLTRKNGGVELKNDGGVGDRWQAEEKEEDHGGLRKRAGTTNLVGATFSAAEAFKPPDLPTRGKNEKKAKKAKPKVEEGIARLVNSLAAIPVPSSSPATIGQGGMPPSGRCDIEALSGRMGRLETCVINAAIMANSYGNRARGKKFNKPIVVDLDLPVWRDNA